MSSLPIREKVASRDGATSELLLYRTADEGAPVVFVIPAMGIGAGYYDKLGAAFAKRGVHAALFELRGNGSSSVRASRGTDFGYGTIVEQDVPAVVERVRAHLPRAPLFFLGHSLGGHLSFLSLARGQIEKVRGIALVASGLPHAVAWPGVGNAAIRTLARFMKTTSTLVGHYPGSRFGFAGREARTLIKEWGHAVRTGKFVFPTTWTGHVAPDEAIARVECPVLAVSLKGDSFAPRRSTELLVAKAPKCPVKWIRYEPESGLPPSAGSHNKWPRHPDAVVAHVADWMLALSPPQDRTVPLH
ncbi:alpha/beta fold hydrolase [Pendulispora albinea]|uniref:Alpha/beta fold hydrolase n=1 Tax=Pendulispora albinea TaxID=2741071 RepID=A0ABZ2LUP1_9BACT